MRIVHITPHYSPDVGGAETYTKELSERLARRGHAVTVLTMNDGGGEKNTDGRLPRVEMINGVKVNRFEPAGKLHALFNVLFGSRGGRRLLGAVVPVEAIDMSASSPYGLAAFSGCLRSNPDVVSVINWFDGWLAYQTDLARQIRGFSLVGVPLFHTERSWVQAPHYAGMLARCDAVVAMTEHERTFIERRSNRHNAHAVGVGVDPAMFADADGASIRTRYSVGDAPLVGYVGRMDASKGVGTLIEAMARVWRTEPGARLLLAGGGMPTNSSRPDEISQALHALSTAERSRIIRIDTFPDDLKASIFDALDVFAMPSVADSFGIAYLEAWMRKKAVIGSRTGSTQCVIDDGRDGVLVEPRNPDDLAGAILRLLGDRAAREDMGRRGLLKTTTHFTWDRITDKIEHIYRQSHDTTAVSQAARANVSRRRGSWA